MEAGSAITKRVAVGDDRTVLIGPLHPDDRDRFLDGIGRASAESMYKRFMTPMTRLTSTQIAYLVGVDHRDHEALLAVDEDGGEAVAVGRFVRSEEDSKIAEAAVLVVDAWHGLGLGKALSRALAERARELGIERFGATMLTDNGAMMNVLKSLGEVRTVADEGSIVSVEVVLPDPEAGEEMPGVIAAVEDGAYELAPPPSD